LSNDTPVRPPFSSSENDEVVFRPAPLEPVSPPARPPLVDDFVSRRHVRFQHVWWKHILLFVLTLFTTTLVGIDRYYQFILNFGRPLVDFGGLSASTVILSGLWYSGTILLILGAHEMGHYLACRWYKVDATLPYFIPIFLGLGGIQTGTLGAVIRIREPFPTRKILFDIGIAGPIAGFVLVVPAIFLGMYLSNVTVIPDGTGITYIGKPLLFRVARWMVFGPVPEGSIVNLHPMVWAAWFGMLATALNLLPFGQLDGGHITYAALGRLASPISLATVASAVLMTIISVSWLLMTVLMVIMLVLFGPRHPPVLDERNALGKGRQALAVFALVMLILCFTPFPIDIEWPWSWPWQ
jgi:membrane-associated protease RseP (regulator of RpoE activity)